MLRYWTRVDQPTELLSEPGALCANRFLDLSAHPTQNRHMSS